MELTQALANGKPGKKFEVIERTSSLYRRWDEAEMVREIFALRGDGNAR